MKKRNILLAFVMVGGVLSSFAQDTAKKVPTDGFYNQDALKNAKPFAYPKVNTSNIEFYRRIWRDIDLKDPTNKVLNTPGASLMDVILEGLQNGKITAFDATSTKENPRGDGFTTTLTPLKAMSTLQDSVLVPVFDDEGNQVRSEMKLNDYNPETVTRFRIKEDIFFDKQRSRVETRIIGIAPLIKIKSGGEMISEQPAFWLYFPECRELFATKEIANNNNRTYKVSFDDIFVQHNFNGVIVKESNSADLSIKDYVEGDGQMKEAKRIEERLDKYKEGIWKY